VREREREKERVKSLSAAIMPKRVRFYCHKDKNRVENFSSFLLELTSIARIFGTKRKGRKSRYMRQACILLPKLYFCLKGEKSMKDIFQHKKL
jgi:hypothetical protein